MKTRLICLLCLILPSLASAGGFPQIDEWQAEGDVVIHRKDDLWKHIDGAAELFLMYGFQMLRYRDFSKGDMWMTVEVYDMATPLNAYGIYTAERGDDTKRLSIGAEAIVAPPYYCQLLKDRFYVKVNMQQGKLDEQTGRAVLSSIDSSVEGAAGLPEELALLPLRDRIAGTAKYITRGYMGVGELNRVLYAVYRDAEGNSYRCFLMLPSTDEPIGDKWQSLSGKWLSVDLQGQAVFLRDVPYSGSIGVIRKDRYILGVSGIEDRKVILDRLADLYSQ